jgi:hypothetical protein
MLPYLLPLPTPLIPLSFTSNGHGTHRFVPITVLRNPPYHCELNPIELRLKCRSCDCEHVTCLSLSLVYIYFRSIHILNRAQKRLPVRTTPVFPHYYLYTWTPAPRNQSSSLLEKLAIRARVKAAVLTVAVKQAGYFNVNLSPCLSTIPCCRIHGVEVNLHPFLISKLY